MKKIIIEISLILILAFVWGVSSIEIGQEISSSKELVYKDIVNEIIRFHVIANSDTKYDQDLKLKVRDSVIEYVSEQVKDYEDLSKSREFLVNNKSKIEEIAKKVIVDNGYDYDVDSKLSNENFPDKVYGDLIFPQGEYEAYRILIGEAKGQNWWCVMFPPLCFVDGTKEAIDTSELEERLSSDKNKQESYKNSIKFKFKIAELFKSK